MTKITKALVRGAMLEDLAASGITSASHIKKMGVVPLTPDECEKLTDIHIPGYEIPYFDDRGRKMGIAKRVKFLAPVPGNPDQKYWQRTDTLPRVYLPPLMKNAKWVTKMQNPATPIYITEGEKKAACACIHGLACMGLGGVWAFKSKKAGLPLVKELEKVIWKGREVFIVFDSDVMEKPDVLRAMQSLSSVLRTKGVLDIKYIYLADGGDEKIGLDDFIVANGVEALNERVSDEADVLLEELNEFNTRYAIVQSMPSKIFSTEKRVFHNHQSFVNVVEAHRVVPIVDDLGKPRKSKVPSEWLEWPSRREFADLVFEPGKPRITDQNQYNFWGGYPYVPKRGSVRPFLDLIDQVFSNSTAEVKRWFLQWASHPLSVPGSKLASAVVIWGDQGTGKTFLGMILKNLYGEYGRLLTNLNLDSSFNEWAINAQFVLADEVVFHGDRRESNALKSIITRDSLIVNQKYQPTYTVKDYANFYFTSNHGDAIHMERGDRRFLVVEAGDKQPRKFYSEIDRWLKEPDSYSNIMHYLTHQIDISQFDPMGEPPVTSQKEEMIHETMSSLDQVLEEAMKSPDEFFQMSGNIIPRDLFTAEEILALMPAEFRNTNRNAVGRALRRAGCPKRGCAIKTPSGGSVFKRLYAVRNIDKWKRASPPDMAKHYGAALRDLMPESNVVNLDERRKRRRKF